MAERFWQRLANGGRTGIFLAALVVTLIALAVPGWAGAVLVVAIVGLLVTIMRRTWAVTAFKDRAVRLAILLLLAYLAFHKVSR